MLGLQGLDSGTLEFSFHSRLPLAYNLYRAFLEAGASQIVAWPRSSPFPFYPILLNGEGTAKGWKMTTRGI